jgi:hypothetical protein
VFRWRVEQLKQLRELSAQVGAIAPRQQHPPFVIAVAKLGEGVPELGQQLDCTEVAFSVNAAACERSCRTASRSTCCCVRDE